MRRVDSRGGPVAASGNVLDGDDCDVVLGGAADEECVEKGVGQVIRG
jgi:hypothetical protein